MDLYVQMRRGQHAFGAVGFCFGLLLLLLLLLLLFEV
jgi:hypothetical protein